MKRFGLVLAAAAAAFILAAVIQAGSEKKLSMGDVPAPVRSAIEHKAGKAKITEIEVEEEDGQKAYEAEFDDAGKKHSIKVTETGELIEEETQIDAAALPKAVRDSLNKNYPGAKIEKSESVVVAFYEMKLESKGKTFEVKVSPTGEIMDDENEDKDHDDDDDGKDK